MDIIISGAGEVGSHLAKMLRGESNFITVIDNDENRLSRLALYADVETVFGNPSSISVLRSAGVDKADLFIAVYPFTTQEVNIVDALLAKQLGCERVLARVNDEDVLSAENKLIFKEMGIDLMFYPEKVAADEIVAQLKHSSTSESMDFAHGKMQITVFRLNEDSPLLDMRLSEFVEQMTAMEASQMRIIAISRDEHTTIPTPATKFQYNDLVYTFATREGLDALTKYFGSTTVKVEKVMIYGGSAIAEMVASSLNRQGIDVKIIEDNKERCLELSEKLPDEITIVNGNGRDTDFLYDEGIRNVDAFIALTSGDEANVLASVAAKKFGVQRTVAEVENIEYIRLAEEMGVDTVINKKLITASRIFKFTLSGTARSVRYMGGTEAEVMEYTVAPGSAITKGKLKDMNFPKNAIIGGIVRGSESFIAVGDTQIEAYDRVAVFTLPQSIKEIDRFFK